jgi:hypothetical protein
MASSGAFDRVRFPSSTSTIIDSVGDQSSPRPKTTQAFGFKSETKNENSIRQSSVRIGSSIHMPQEPTEVNVHNHYYNTLAQVDEGTQKKN